MTSVAEIIFKVFVCEGTFTESSCEKQLDIKNHSPVVFTDQFLLFPEINFGELVPNNKTNMLQYEELHLVSILMGG